MAGDARAIPLTIDRYETDMSLEKFKLSIVVLKAAASSKKGFRN